VPERRKWNGGIAAIAGIGMIAVAAWAIRHGTVEFAQWVSPKEPERAAFDERYSEARVRPAYTLTTKEGVYPRTPLITLTVEESRGDYLVQSTYEGHFGYSGEEYMNVVLYKMTISVRDRNMQPVGRLESYKMSWMVSGWTAGVMSLNRSDHDWQKLVEGLEAGIVVIADHDRRVDNHLLAIREYQDKKIRYEAEYAKRTQRGLE
jgi:hypothetical protein